MLRAASTFLTAVTLTVLCGIPANASPPVAAAEARVCSAPSTPSSGFERATAAEVGMDSAALQRAVDFASSRLRTNIQIFKNNCLVGEGPANNITENTPWHLWSSTKSVVAMVAGVAVTEGLLDVDAPIGQYLPLGQGDEAHRAITVRALLNQSSGLAQAVISEALASGLDLGIDAPGEALQLPIVAPGQFQYSQRGTDLLAYVIEKAVGEDLQAFAQRTLFDPVGISARDYYWARDRTGHTYGFAKLLMPPHDFARLGMLMLNDGTWNGKRIISSAYINELRAPSPDNACYGFLFWLNRSPCTGPSLPSQKTLDVTPLAGLPDDAYAMVGFLQQNNFIVPSLDLQVTWTGVFGDVSPDFATLISASTNSELYHEFFGQLIQALPPYVDSVAPYVPTPNNDVNIGEFFDPNIVLGSLGIGDLASQLGGEVAAPLAGTPFGCFLLACLPISSDTPHRVGS
ncbi:hydrolase [Rhodococcus sp. Leaf278]|uniref:serine hydrolase domain-containing protein n=1 Tax=Rhodococcus sp. Leaf278 TaxID=1736319 RepID=UPI000708FC90|nr:serine hydrolase [Rhodococcus sp. Leaf278]KQU45067.1 hydrolase [Rhodococcus sp. Leaf278]